MESGRRESEAGRTDSTGMMQEREKGRKSPLAALGFGPLSSVSLILLFVYFTAHFCYCFNYHVQICVLRIIKVSRLTLNGSEDTENVSASAQPKYVLRFLLCPLRLSFCHFLFSANLQKYLCPTALLLFIVRVTFLVAH